MNRQGTGQMTRSIRPLTRRNVLRGLGVTLFLPWLETFSGKARAQAGTYPKRFLPIYFPNGAAADFWPAVGEGEGPAWQLSQIQEPLAPIKQYLTVMTNMENYSPFTPRVHDENQTLDIGPRPDSHVEPSHALLSGAFLTCADSDAVRAAMGAAGDVPVSGISLDQLLVQSTQQETALASLQVGLSTLDSSTDGRHPALSRSISWASPTEPLYKEVNPQAVFDSLIAVNPNTGGADPAAALEAEKRRALDQSSLDAVLESAQSVQQRVSYSDRSRMDQFLESVRDLEQRSDSVGDAVAGAMCAARERPADAYGVGAVPGDYDRGVHTDVMSDLIVMAFECDITRVVSYMLDDARSEFEYRHIQARDFGATPTTPRGMGVGGFHGLQHAGENNQDFASINWSLTEKVTQLAQKLEAIPEGDGNMLEHMLIFYASGMHGSDHDGFAIPALLIGGGDGTFKRDYHHLYPAQKDGQGAQFADLFLTIARNYYGLTSVESFGSSAREMTELLV